MAKTVARKTATQSLSLIHRSNVNGLSFSDYALILPHLENGVELVVIAHDDNKHDDRAVALYLKHPDGEWEIDGENAFHVGWLPNNLDESKGAKKILWTLLDKGFNLRAKILNHDKNANFQNRLFIGIWLEH